MSEEGAVVEVTRKAVTPNSSHPQLNLGRVAILSVLDHCQANE